MIISLNQVLSIYKGEDLNAFIKDITGFTLEEKNLSYNKISANWKFLGGSSSNASSIGILRNGEKGLIERITNGIDAVMELKKQEFNIGIAKEPSGIIRAAFPKYYKNRQDISNGLQDRAQEYESRDYIVLAVNDGSKSNKPTFDVLDRGIGLAGDEFESTILSLQHGNKLSADKGYLIGAFGQGGSTSLPFAHSTIILSKKNGKISFTIVKPVNLTDYKNHCYVYLTINNMIPEVSVTNFIGDDYVRYWLESDSGTFVRMIEMDISKKLRDNDITKPGKLVDYVNTELFNVSLPVKIIENRTQYRENQKNQNRNAFGTFSKLQTFKAYVNKEYCGRINIDINGNSYTIDYYVILPSKEENWGKDSEAKRTFEQFNVSCDPILYTVNGQTITSDSFTKLKNAGLSFLKYRLLIVINLDVLGTDKYKFFTTDRNQIKDTDITQGFLDKVVTAITGVEKLKEINSIIAEKAINEQVDNELIDDISKEVKGLYSRFLQGGSSISGFTKRKRGDLQDEEIFNDSITEIEITTSKNCFYKDQVISFVLTTHARKDINQNAFIYCFIDQKGNYNYTKASMNGRNQYSWGPGTIEPGVHTIQFQLFENSTMKCSSNPVAFEVLNQNAPEPKSKQVSKELNLKISLLTEQELICDIIKSKDSNSIEAKLCLESDIMNAQVYGLNTSAEKIKETQKRVIKPLVLFALFLGKAYDDIEDTDKKNDIIISFLKAFLASSVEEL